MALVSWEGGPRDVFHRIGGTSFPAAGFAAKKQSLFFFRGRGFKGGYLFHKLTRRALFTLSIPRLEHVRAAA
jgi:hypothetical protein